MAEKQLGLAPSAPTDATTKAYVDNTISTLVTSAVTSAINLATNSYSVNIGNGLSTTITVTHNLSTLDVVTSVFLLATGEEVDCDVIKVNANSISLKFATAPTNNSMRCTVIGTAIGLAGASVPTTSGDIIDASIVGRSILTAADAAAVRTVIGAGSLVLGSTSSTAKAGDYQPASTNITDSTATGRSLITAVDAAAARTAIGAGTSSLALGTTSSTAKAGDYQPAATNISDSTVIGRTLLTAADAAAVRTAIDAVSTTQSNQYAATIGTGSATSIAVNHNLATRDVVVSVYDYTTGEMVECDVAITTANTVTVTFGTAPAAGALRCVVMGTAYGIGSPTAVVSAGITDATVTGRALITAADAAAARTAIGFRDARTHVDLRDWVDVRNANWKTFLGAAWTVGGTTLTSSNSQDGTRFSSADVGKIIMILTDNSAAPYVYFKTTITAVNGTTATVNDALPATGGNAENTYSRVRYGFDGTTAINAALAEVDSSLDGPVEVYLGGNYRATQIIIPSGVTLSGVPWKKSTVTGGSSSGAPRTVLTQLPGAEKDFIIWGVNASLPVASWIGGSGLRDIELQGPEINVAGISAATVGNGVAFRTEGNTSGGIIDGFTLYRVGAYNFPESGFRCYGALPFYVNECKALFNGRYGFEKATVSGGQNGGHNLNFVNFSADWNNLGALGFKGMVAEDTVLINGLKSEGTVADAESAGYRGNPNNQTNCIVIDNCDSTNFLINGLSHIRIIRADIGAGPAITIRDSTGASKKPNINFNSVNVRISGLETVGTTDDAVTLRDEISSVDVPQNVHSGHYPTMTLLHQIVDQNGKNLLFINPIDDATNSLILTNSTGSNPFIIGAAGEAADVGIALQTKGNSCLYIGTSATGLTPRLRSYGVDTNMDLSLESKGTGKVLVNFAEACRRTVQTVTTSTTLLTNGDYIVFISGASGAVTLPTVVGNTSRYTIKNTHTTDKTITATSPQLIDGAATLTLPAGDSVDLVSDGTAWRVI